MSFTISTSPPAELRVDGGTIQNYGPDALYYSDRLPVDATDNDGSFAMGESVSLGGTQYFASAGRSTVDFTPSEVSVPGGGSGNGRVLWWDEETEDYIPAEWRTDTSQPREFRGRISPEDLGSVVGPTPYDVWTPDREPAA